MTYSRTTGRGMTAEPWELATGQGSLSRGDVDSQAIAVAGGSLRLAYFTATKSFTATQVRVTSGTTAAGATPSLIRVGLYTVAANGDLALVASTPSDTTLLAAASTAYTKAFSAPYTMVQGQEYATGILVVTAATAPTLVGHSIIGVAEMFIAPRLAGAVAGADLPATFAGGSVAITSHRPYIAILP